MSCKPCAARRKALLAKREAKKQARKPIQAAAIGAVLAVTEAAGKVLGIGEDTEDATEQRGTGPSSSAASGENKDASP